MRRSQILLIALFGILPCAIGCDAEFDEATGQFRDGDEVLEACEVFDDCDDVDGMAQSPWDGDYGWATPDDDDDEPEEPEEPEEEPENPGDQEETDEPDPGQGEEGEEADDREEEEGSEEADDRDEAEGSEEADDREEEEGEPSPEQQNDPDCPDDFGAC